MFYELAATPLSVSGPLSALDGVCCALKITHHMGFIVFLSVHIVSMYIHSIYYSTTYVYFLWAIMWRCIGFIWLLSQPRARERQRYRGAVMIAYEFMCLFISVFGVAPIHEGLCFVFSVMI